MFRIELNVQRLQEYEENAFSFSCQNISACFKSDILKFIYFEVLQVT